MDDMIVAASFATMVPLQSAPVEEGGEKAADVKPAAQQTVDAQPSSPTEEVDSDSESDDESSDDSSDGPVKGDQEAEVEDKNESDDDKDSDDDDSDFDLTEALSKMENDSGEALAGDGNNNGGGKGSAPKTEHEVDAYHTSIQELQSNFQLNLSVQEQEYIRLAGCTTDSSIKLGLAGKIKSHLVQDRTIVVESQNTAKGPLDEGSLLVIRYKDPETSELRLAPLGKVFEVFGPVFRPLYSVRLPAPPSKASSSKTKAKAKSREPAVPPPPSDENEISIDDENASMNPESEESPSTSQKEETKLAASPAEDEETKLDGAVDADQPSNNSQNEEKESDADGDREKNADGVNEEKQLVAGNKETEKSDSAAAGASSKPQGDNWSVSGRMTKVVAATQSMQVYFIEDEVRLIDTRSIMRQSGRGCDASNLYDEEVVNATDMYFSDDEEEKQFKRGKKSKGKGGGRNNNHNSSKATKTHAPRGHNTPYNIPGFHPAQPQGAPQQSAYAYPPPQPPYYGTGQMYYHPSQQPQYGTYPPQWPQPVPPGYVQYPPYSTGAAPTPPPPGQYQYPYPYQPPPQDPNQSSDTVYYDYSGS